jgi:hypothetical protein
MKSKGSVFESPTENPTLSKFEGVVITGGCVITAGIGVVVVACVVVVVACVVVCGGFSAVVVVVSEKQNIYIGRVFSFR